MSYYRFDVEIHAEGHISMREIVGGVVRQRDSVAKIKNFFLACLLVIRENLCA